MYCLSTTDIDECSETPGICGKQTVCTNVPGTFYCSCPDGFFPSTGIVWTLGVSFCQSELWMQSVTVYTVHCNMMCPMTSTCFSCHFPLHWLNRSSGDFRCDTTPRGKYCQEQSGTFKERTILETKKNANIKTLLCKIHNNITKATVISVTCHQIARVNVGTFLQTREYVETLHLICWNISLRFSFWSFVESRLCLWSG